MLRGTRPGRPRSRCLDPLPLLANAISPKANLPKSNGADSYRLEGGLYESGIEPSTLRSRADGDPQIGC